MIKSIRHKGLAELYREGTSRKVPNVLMRRIIGRLQSLHKATDLQDMNVHGYDFHLLRGMPQRYSVHINGPWCITFEWRNGEAWNVDLEQYH
ncbi:MAG: type II toxin-antitoxin system RelE/ParE family toxin [Proteobacteria bacterium]|nr:type II toxin-antitoxin system RelE/ParE family toxin [Pseudomonadota bacterium]